MVAGNVLENKRKESEEEVSDEPGISFTAPDYQNYPVSGYPIGSAYGHFGPTVFYDTKLYDLALKEAGFEGLVLPKLEEPFCAHWSESAWSKIVDCGYAIVKRTKKGETWVAL